MVANQRSHVWFRWFNELPVLVLFAVGHPRGGETVLNFYPFARNMMPLLIHRPESGR